jgi:hypothetical protein
MIKILNIVLIGPETHKTPPLYMRKGVFVSITYALSLLKFKAIILNFNVFSNI